MSFTFSRGFWPSTLPLLPCVGIDRFGRRLSHTGKRSVLVDYGLSARDRGCDSYCPTRVRIGGNALRLGGASFSQSRQNHPPFKALRCLSVIGLVGTRLAFARE